MDDNCPAPSNDPILKLKFSSLNDGMETITNNYDVSSYDSRVNIIKNPPTNNLNPVIDNLDSFNR